MPDTTINQDLPDLIHNPGLPPAKTQKILGCGPTKFWELLKNGELKAYYIGRSPRVPLSEIKRYREAHTKQPRKAEAA